jgi:hypothetical protein
MTVHTKDAQKTGGKNIVPGAMGVNSEWLESAYWTAGSNWCRWRADFEWTGERADMPILTIPERFLRFTSRPHLGEGAMKPEARYHPEDAAVDATGIWHESHASYPGRSTALPCATGVERRRDGAAEVSRGRSSRTNRRRAEPVGEAGTIFLNVLSRCRASGLVSEVSAGSCNVRYKCFEDDRHCGPQSGYDRNRRVRNRTHGGVGGGTPQGAPYPIFKTENHIPYQMGRMAAEHRLHLIAR